MARCRGEKPDRTPCERIVPASQEYCYSHDPARKEERRRNASKAARSKPSADLREIKTLLKDLIDRVLGKEDTEALGTGPASVANQLINTRLRAVELERKAREVDELEARLEALEQATGNQKGGRAKPWGA